MDTRILDYRSRQTQANRIDACEMRGPDVVQRKLEDVTACAIHQTACYFSVVKSQLAAAGGDEELARHTRFLAVNAHAVAGRHGMCVIGHSVTDYVNHGHQLNPFSWGLEHELLCDVNGELITPPKGFSYDNVIEAGRAGLTWFVENAPNAKYVYAHRQAFRKPKGAKTSDPGARVFKAVAVEHGVKKLGLSIEPNRIWGYGHPLPKNWYT